MRPAIRFGSANGYRDQRVDGQTLRRLEAIMMDNRIIRAWKDEEYRLTLGADERAALPESPVGRVELTDEQLGDVAGGNVAITQTSICVTSLGCVTGAAYAISKNVSAPAPTMASTDAI